MHIKVTYFLLTRDPPWHTMSHTYLHCARRERTADPDQVEPLHLTLKHADPLLFVLVKVSLRFFCCASQARERTHPPCCRSRAHASGEDRVTCRQTLEENARAPPSSSEAFCTEESSHAPALSPL